MALETNVTPAKIAVALGVPAPPPGSPQEQQWQMWITDALLLIQIRVDELGIDESTIDQAKLDYVIREAVVAQARRPDDSTQVTTSVDDGSVSRIYRSSSGRVGILDEWWALLGLTAPGGGAFDIDTVSTTRIHRDICSLNLGALYCSCGADIAGYPIYEGGAWV